MKNIMLDLETFGTNPFSTIISLGAVYFDAGGIKKEFYVTIDPIASERSGFRSDMSTICWWLDPARSAAYKEWFQTVHFEPEVALQGFSMWLEGLFHGEPMPEDWQGEIAMWGNGPAFDNEILRNAYKLLNIPCPWTHWGDRCFRTMKNLTLDSGEHVISARDLAPPHEGNVHNALIDARQQAQWLVNITKNFDLTL